MLSTRINNIFGDLFRPPSPCVLLPLRPFHRPPPFSSLTCPLVLIRTCSGLQRGKWTLRFSIDAPSGFTLCRSVQIPTLRSCATDILNRYFDLETEGHVIVFSSSRGQSQAHCAFLHQAVLDRSMDEVRSAEHTSVVDSEEGVRAASLGSFPNALAGAAVVHLFHTFFDWCLRKGDPLSLHEASRRRHEMCLWRHMRSPVSSAWPTAFGSKQFLEDPHARASPSVAHSIFFHLQTKHSVVSCPVPTLRQDARSVVTLEPWIW